MSFSQSRSNISGPSLLALGLCVLGEDKNLPISKNRLQTLKDAVSGARRALAFEEKFSSIIDNYIEFELCLIETSMNYCVRPLQVKSVSFEKMRELNRRLTNFLSVTRQYLTQNEIYIEPLLVGSEASFKHYVTQEYNSSLAYRVMQLLRNYVQHRDLGVHSIKITGGWIDLDDDGKKRMRYSATAFLNIELLQSDKKFTKKELGVIEELRSQPFQPDLPQLVREYVSALSRIHKSIRNSLGELNKGWKKQIRQAHIEFKDRFPNADTIGLCVIYRHPCNTRSPVLEINIELPELLEESEELNWCPTNLGRSHISSEYIPLPWKD